MTNNTIILGDKNDSPEPHPTERAFVKSFSSASSDNNRRLVLDTINYMIYVGMIDGPAIQSLLVEEVGEHAAAAMITSKRRGSDNPAVEPGDEHNPDNDLYLRGELIDTELGIRVPSHKLGSDVEPTSGFIGYVALGNPSVEEPESDIPDASPDEPKTPTFPAIETLVPYRPGRTTEADAFKVLTLLSIETKEGPAFFVVEGMSKFCSVEELQDRESYYYQEHTCPTNFIRIPLISINHDHDPHGLFRHVASVWMTQEYVDAIEGRSVNTKTAYLLSVFPAISGLED